MLYISANLSPPLHPSIPPPTPSPLSLLASFYWALVGAVQKRVWHSVPLLSELCSKLQEAFLTKLLLEPTLQCSSQSCWTSSIGITWELVQNANSQAQLQTNESKTLGLGPSKMYFNKHFFVSPLLINQLRQKMGSSPYSIWSMWSYL